MLTNFKNVLFHNRDPMTAVSILNKGLLYFRISSYMKLYSSSCEIKELILKHR